MEDRDGSLFLLTCAESFMVCCLTDISDAYSILIVFLLSGILRGPRIPVFRLFFDNFIRIILTLHMAYDRIIFVKVWNIAVLTNLLR